MICSFIPYKLYVFFCRRLCKVEFIIFFITLKDKESMFLKEMKKYSIPKALLTDLYMYRRTIASQNTMLGNGFDWKLFFWNDFNFHRSQNFMKAQTHLMFKENYVDKFERYRLMMIWMTSLSTSKMETSHLSLSHRKVFI